jgi:RNA polymerase sigma-70 factor (ECF subfamily)
MVRSEPRTSGGRQGDDEADLVLRAQAGDSRAVDLLARRYLQKVYAIAYRLSGYDAEEARDNAQDALLQAFRHIKRFEGRSRFSTWIYRVAVNSCRDARRRRLRWRRLLVPWQAERGEAEPAAASAAAESGGVEASALAGLNGEELRRQVRQVLAGLSEKQRLVFELKVFEDLSISEIAGATGMAEGTVKTHLFRATRSVREGLRGWAGR